MNKQEFQQKIKNMEYKKDCVYMSSFDVYLKGFEKAKELALLYSNSLDEPEKPVVPQYVADMIVKRKNAGQSIVKAIENLRFYEVACKWVRANAETFVKAWLYGYEVEKEEKLYTVEIPNPNYTLQGHYILYKNEAGKVCLDYHYFDDWKNCSFMQLTEAEIKKDFAYLWEFAEEVVDDE